MEFSDKEFKLLIKGDKKTFKRLYLYYKDKIFHYLVIKTSGDHNMANEIFSDTIYSALKSVNTLKNSKNIQGWLFMIANRRFNDYLRDKYKEEKKQNSINTDECYAEDTANEIIEKEKILTLNIALSNIKPEYSKILKMKYLEGKSQKEISTHMNKSVGAVEGLLFRARESLKKELHNSLELFKEVL